MREADTVLRPEKSFLQILYEYGYPLISKEVSNLINLYKYSISHNTPFNKSVQSKLISDNKSQYSVHKYLPMTKAPFNVTIECCRINKEKPLQQYEKKTKKIGILGTMASESKLRTQSWLVNGCNSFNTPRKQSRPMMFWTEQDVLQYIKENNIEIAKEYGKIIDTDGRVDVFGNCKHCYKTTGQNRTGCKFCMFGISMDRERMSFYKEHDPTFYDYAMRGGEFVDGVWKPKNGLGLKFVIDWLNENIDTFKRRPIKY